MKVLTLDVGNTTIDACEFERGEPKHLGRFGHEEIFKLSGEYDVVGVVSVKNSLIPPLREVFSDRLRVVSLKDIPIEIDYRTPQTLGADRVLFAYGVRELYTENAVLVSAGTALVIDLLLEGVFKGGFITSGLGLKLSCLSERAEGIPEFKASRVEGLVGRSTEECVLGGAYLESRFFIERTAERWSKEFKKELKLFITGGDGKLFEDMGFYDPLILHRALYRLIINE